MTEYQVSVEHSGRQIPVGRIEETDGDGGRFFYLDDYLRQPDAVPVSISLPLETEAFSEEQTRTFFEGLLPEGFTRKSVAQHLRIDEGNYLSMLAGLGRECLGAIRISDDVPQPEAGYEKVTEKQIRELAAEGAVRSAEMVTKAHLSLTGASGKAGLYFDGSSGEWYLPHGTAPSTHIVKQSHVRLDGIVANEQLCLLTAAHCGIAVPDSFIINTGSFRDEDVLFATKRYDRIIDDRCEILDGLRIPFRLHQEDFAQAMGIPSLRKYEPEDGHYMEEMFSLLRRYSADPITDQLRLWDMIVFNYLVGNTDGHIKNYSMLYSPDMQSMHLAPAYDLVSTVVYESSTREMAFSIGGDLLVDDITTESFQRAAEQVGLGERLAMSRFDDICGRFREALDASAGELAELGFFQAEQIAQTILERGGINRMNG